MTPWTLQSMEFSRLEYWSGSPFSSPRDRPNPGIEPRSPALQVDFLPAEPQGKLKNTGVGCRSLLQGIFPTWGLNPGLLLCRWILYHLSHQGNPQPRIFSAKCQYCGVWASLGILSKDSVCLSLSHIHTQNHAEHIGTRIHTYCHLCPPRHLPGLC